MAFRRAVPRARWQAKRQVARQVKVWLALLIVVAGVVSSGAAWEAARREERTRVTGRVDQQADAVGAVVEAELDRYIAAAEQVAAGLGAQSDLSHADFLAVTAPVASGRLAGVTGIGYVVATETAGIARLQAYWRARGAEGLRLAPVPAAGLHYFAVLTRSLTGRPRSVARDQAAATDAVAALVEARRSGKVTVSRTYVLLSDRALPAARRPRSFVIVAPVVAAPNKPDGGRFRGWVLLGLRGGPFLTAVIRRASAGQVNVALADASSRTSGGDSVAVARVITGPAADRPALVRRATIAVGRRSWQLRIIPTTALLAPDTRRADAVITAAGMALSVALAVLVWMIGTSRDRALRQVARATSALEADLARRQCIEAELRASEAELRGREAELEAFAAVAAHDLKGPLASIAGHAELLDEVIPAGSEAAGFLDRIKTGTTRMRRLIDDLLAYAAASGAPLTCQPVDLTDLVAQIVQERTGHLTAGQPVIDLYGPLPTVNADPMLVRQVLDNLIGNALKYVVPGRTAQIQISAARASGAWRIQVTDRGIGIDPADRGTVFGTFHRAPGSEQYAGTGLGLAICRRLIERHGGTIDVQPNPAGGSIFWFTLPD